MEDRPRLGRSHLFFDTGVELVLHYQFNLPRYFKQRPRITDTKL